MWESSSRWSIGLRLAQSMETELRQALDDLGLGDRVRVERVSTPRATDRE